MKSGELRMAFGTPFFFNLPFVSLWHPFDRKKPSL